jgi:hypothetical protein
LVAIDIEDKLSDGRRLANAFRRVCCGTSVVMLCFGGFAGFPGDARDVLPVVAFAVAVVPLLLGAVFDPLLFVFGIAFMFDPLLFVFGIAFMFDPLLLFLSFVPPGPVRPSLFASLLAFRVPEKLFVSGSLVFSVNEYFSGNTKTSWKASTRIGVGGG